jgi:hypothetical protein
VHGAPEFQNTAAVWKVGANFSRPHQPGLISPEAASPAGCNMFLPFRSFVMSRRGAECLNDRVGRVDEGLCVAIPAVPGAVMEPRGSNVRGHLRRTGLIAGGRCGAAHNEIHRLDALSRRRAGQRWRIPADLPTRSRHPFAEHRSIASAGRSNLGLLPTRPTRQSLQKIATNGSRPESSISPSVSFSWRLKATA